MMKMAAVEDTWENSAEKKNWMGKVDNALLDSALDALWKIELQEREIDFMDGHRVNIKELVAEYLKEHPDKRFVGVAHMANRRKHVVMPAAVSIRANSTWNPNRPRNVVELMILAGKKSPGGTTAVNIP